MVFILYSCVISNFNTSPHCFEVQQSGFTLQKMASSKTNSSNLSLNYSFWGRVIRWQPMKTIDWHYASLKFEVRLELLTTLAVQNWFFLVGDNRFFLSWTLSFWPFTFTNSSITDYLYGGVLHSLEEKKCTLFFWINELIFHEKKHLLCFSELMS